MANTITAAAAGQAATTPDATRPSGAPTVGSQEVSKDMFLKLMVAQLRNQNPLNPVDGVDFLSQLSQISGVEQMVEMRQQLTAIHKILAGSGTPAAQGTQK
jgi:flagellar basal-body rod modification protein FlgD